MEFEDELFFISKGKLLIRLRDQPDVPVDEGEFVIIPKGVEHLPVAQDEVHAVLIEPKTTVNTGNIRNNRTVGDEWIKPTTIRPLSSFLCVWVCRCGHQKLNHLKAYENRQTHHD